MSFKKQEFEPVFHEVVSAESYRSLKKEYDKVCNILTAMSKYIELMPASAPKEALQSYLHLAPAAGDSSKKDSKEESSFPSLDEFLRQVIEASKELNKPRGFSTHIYPGSGRSRHDDLCNACREGCGEAGDKCGAPKKGSKTHSFGNLDSFYLLTTPLAELFKFKPGSGRF